MAAVAVVVVATPPVAVIAVVIPIER